MKFHSIIAVPGLACLLAFTGIEAAERRPELDFSASGAWAWDSNVNVADLDENTGEGDAAVVLDAGLGLRIPLNGRLSTRLDYEYSDTSYRDFSEFDLALHSVSGELGYRIGGFDAALTGDRFVALLDGERYLELDRITPSVSRLIGKQLFLRGAYTRTGKSWPDSEGRDADNESVRADLYWLIDGMDHFVSLGLSGDSEDAMDGAYDYDGRRASIAWGRTLDFGPRSLELRARLAWEVRDYAASIEGDEPPRHDERLRTGVTAKLPLAKSLALSLDVSYADVGSTLSAAACDEVVAMLGIGVEL